MGLRKKKRLKIAILVDELVSGGVQKAAIEETRCLTKFGHEVILFVIFRTKNKYQYQDLAKDIKIIYLSDYNPPLFKKPLKIPFLNFLTSLNLISPFFAKRYQKIFRKVNVIICHGTTTCITAAAISHKFNIPYFAFIWDPLEYILQKIYANSKIGFLSPIIKIVVNRIETKFLNQAAEIIIPSTVHKNFIEKKYYARPIIIYPGYSNDKTLKDKDRKYILAYTRWDLTKNPKFFIKAAQRITKAKFLIAGSWRKKEEKEEFINDLKEKKLTNRFKFFPDVKKSDLATIASQSLAWIHPHVESFGMAGLEMASYGLPIIIARGSGITELFEDKVHGFFPKTEQEFFEAINTLVNNKQLAQKMGESAQKTAKLYTWEKHSRELESEIQSYIAKKKLLIFANAFVTEKSTGGGDIFMIELAKRANFRFENLIITTKVGLSHFTKRGVGVDYARFFVLGKTIFDDSDNRLYILIAYLARCVQSLFLVKKIANFDILFSATDFIPDILAAYFYKRKHKNHMWAARIFHVFESPFKRKGSFIVNTYVHLIQKLSFSLLKHADLIMIDNPKLKDELTKIGFSKNKIEVHTGGVDIKKIQSNKPKRNMSIDGLFVGRLQEHKGIFDAIDTWAKVVKTVPGAKLSIMGYGPPAIISKIKNKIKAKKLSNNVELSGYFTDFGEIVAHYKAAKFLLFLDHEAGFGLVVVEAMSAGLPVIAYNLPIFGSTYKSGFVTAPLADTDRVAQNIIELLKDQKKLKMLSKKALQESKKFDWDKVSRKFYASLNSDLLRTTH